MKNFLSKIIIKATKENDTDVALERMTHLAVQKNLASQQALVRSQQGNLNHLQDDVYDLQKAIKKKDLEIYQLQQKLRIAIDMYEEANNNTGSWIELLHKPLHVIAQKHEGFKKSYEAMMKSSVGASQAEEDLIDLDVLLNKPFEEIAQEHSGFKIKFEAMQWQLAQAAMESFTRGQALLTWAQDEGYSDLDVHIAIHEKVGEALKDATLIAEKLQWFYFDSLEEEVMLPLVEKFHSELMEIHQWTRGHLLDDIAASGEDYDLE